MSRYCDKSAAHMYEYIDCEVTLYHRFRIWWHLRRCPPCEHGFHFEVKLLDRVREDCHEIPPTELYDRLQAFLDEHGASAGNG